ncbi:MAG: IS1634 family transposase [Candidatus Thermoplasmatota archaeon]|nr:IS1634 family transposase [Candidatus Thermoplasmatota archaeon]
MTYIRRLVRGNNVYLYEVTSYRDKETGKVRQRSEYKGKEIIKDNTITVRKPRNRITARKVLDSAPYIIYRFAEDFGIQDSFISALDGFTNIREAARRIVILAAGSIMGSFGSIDLHTGIHDGSVKEDRDLMDLAGSLDPDIISILERSLSGRIVKSFGSSGIVYDLSAIRYFGSCNDLAGYGHYYHSNGGKKEINFVLAVTRDHGIPIHHRILSGSIVSVSTVKNFVSDLMDFGIASIMIVMDRGFYSKKNILDLKRYSLIGAIPATLTLYRDLLSRSRGIENSRNYIPSGNDTIFHMEHSVEGTRYIVFFSTKLRADKIQAFYSNLSDMERDLHEMQDQEFNSEQDMIRSVTAAGKMLKYIEIIPSGKAFTYRLKHNAIQARTNRMGFFVLFTNTRMSAEDILRIYRQKDVVEKAFMHSKQCMQPLYARSERGTRARMFLSILGYSIMAMIASRSGFTYQQTEKIISGIKEVVYTNGSHSVVELTKEQKELLEKISIEL